MRSDSKIPAIWTIINDREYIWWLESRYSWWHKRNYITVKCLKCWLESHIESKWFWKYWCKCVRLEEKRWTRHWFWSKNNRNRFYEIFNGIKRRCKWTATGWSSKWYHDKGIKCEWETFEQFRDDMYESYIDHVNKYWEKQTTIDRIDGNWNYCKSNCRWATCTEQNKNRAITNYIEYKWKKYSAWELAEATWMTREQASYRISSVKSWDIPLDSLLKPHRDAFVLEAVVDWKTYRSKDIGNITWVNPRNARKRLRDYIDWKITKEKLFAPKSRWI